MLLQVSDDGIPRCIIPTNIHESHCVPQAGKHAQSRCHGASAHEKMIMRLLHAFMIRKISHHPEIIQRGRTYSHHLNTPDSSFGQ
jgi:hypothetical protein